MIKITVKNGENLDKALKRFKRKFEQTQVMKELRERMAFKKPSVKKREQKQKAKYIQQFKNDV